jgi:branched-subunit amino acid aminotransferase/4-amino-4-deoxychorismate lyase
MNAKKIFLDGKFMEAGRELLESLAPGVIRGKGAFETMRVRGGRIFVLEAHLERLFRGLRLLNIKSPYSRKQLEQRLYGIVMANGHKDARLRLTVWKNKKRVHAAIVCQKNRTTGGSIDRQGIRAVISSVCRRRTRYSHIKSLGYLCFRQAYLEAVNKGYAEAILLNRRGKIVEGSRTNIFFVKGGTLYTPAVSCGCLNGITRRIVLRFARHLRIPCQVVTADVKSLLQADEAFVTNSIFGVMPLTRVNGRAIGRGKAGPVTEKLRKAYCTKLHLACPSQAKSV